MRRTRATAVACLLLIGAAGTLIAQEDPALRRAVAAYDSLNYGVAVRMLRQLTGRGSELNGRDLIIAYQRLGFAAAALDSAAVAVEAFSNLILLAPDSEPDAVVSPRIRQYYVMALGEVLAVQHLRADSASFTVGQGGAVPIRFRVSQAARVTTRVVGGGIDVVVDSQSVQQGEGVVLWHGVDGAGAPVPAGRYDVIVRAVAGRSPRENRITLEVTHTTLDTTAHALPGYTPLAEMETPPRDLEPLGLSALYSAVAVVLTITLPRTQLGNGFPRELVVAGGLAVSLGTFVSLRRPQPRPVPESIRLNRDNRAVLDAHNVEIIRENEAIRRRVVLVIRPVPQPR